MSSNKIKQAGRRVLVVEDEDVLRLTFQQFLEEEGHAVSVAHNFETAVALLDTDEFDAIVTDILLEEKTGIDLLRVVHEGGLRCPVIMITGQPSVGSASEAVRLGAFDYLPKPVTGRELTRVVRLALEQKRLLDERDVYSAKMDEYRRDLDAIFNSVTDGIVMVDGALYVRRMNHAAESILAIAATDSCGEPMQSVLTGPLEPLGRALETSLSAGRQVTDIRLEYVPRGKPARIVVGHSAPLIEEGGNRAGAVLTVRDVTRLTQLELQLSGSQGYHSIIARSRKMRDIFALIEQLRSTDSTVLICGESGTGKEMIATAVHATSERSSAPFLKVNCAALAEDILESELFGHVKGAFTGADRDRVGRFEAANNGTILLDEIGDISPRLQLRLLRVLQSGEFERVGDSAPSRSNVRVIACTNQDLKRKIELGEFRQDLYYRLNVVRIDIPPLRDRREDIPLLLDYFCRRFNALFRKEVTGVADDTMAILMRYPWYGNVREMENCMERSFIVCSDTKILPSHLPPEIAAFVPAAGTASHHSAGLGDSQSERDRILAVLVQTDWNVAKCARLLGVARNTLYNKIKVLNLTRPS